jgi:hypothetical protein
MSDEITEAGIDDELTEGEQAWLLEELAEKRRGEDLQVLVRLALEKAQASPSAWGVDLPRLRRALAQAAQAFADYAGAADPATEPATILHDIPF